MKGFEAEWSAKAVKALTHLQLNDNNASMHKLAFIIRNMLSTEASKDRTPRAAVKYGDIHANEAFIPYADRLCYFLGYDNGVYTNFLKPVHKVLLEAPDANADDFLDVQEACTAAVVLGQTEMAEHFHAYLSSESPSISFPFNGTQLVADDGPFKVRMADIARDLRNPHSKLYSRHAPPAHAMMPDSLVHSVCLHIHHIVQCSPMMSAVNAATGQVSLYV